MNGLATGFEFVFALVLMLGVVITVHEFGHFLAAKLCGVRVLKFSIGFGPPIGIGRFRLAWHRGGTDYVIAWLPLGGFVKMLGENPDEEEAPEVVEDPEHTLGAKALWQKLTIVFAGPAMNLLLPVVVLAAGLAVGVQRAGPVVGTVERGSPAERAGLRAGDRILGVDGEPVSWWDDVTEAVRRKPGERLDLEIERDGQRSRVELEVARRSGLDVFRASSEVGWLGLQHPRQKAVVGVVDGESEAARAGLRSGDRVAAVDGVPVEDWPGLVEAYAAAAGPVVLDVVPSLPAAAEPEAEAGGEGVEEAAEPPSEPVTVPALGDVAELGLIPAVVLVGRVEPDSAAGDAGLAAGDLIIAVDGAPIGSFFTFQETVLASQGRSLQITVARGGETWSVPIAPRVMKTEIGGNQEELYRIGIQGENAILPGHFATDRETNPLVSVPRAAAMTGEITGLFLQGLKKLVVGEISRKNIGGPIEIAKQSHNALQRGWDTFLNLLVLISINIGILNLLPIPILDGGQALMFTVEGVKRAPLSLRTRLVVQQIGLMVLVFLMGFAFWNDISRHWSSFVEWVRAL